jgi:hypothetical protein
MHLHLHLLLLLVGWLRLCCYSQLCWQAQVQQGLQAQRSLSFVQAAHLLGLLHHQRAVGG